MNIYKTSDLTFGFELELSNVPKSLEIPNHLGKWEYCECDIVNTEGKYKNICADPRGVNPPVGGEINTYPTNTYLEQVDRIDEIIQLFKEYKPDTGITAHSHIHVHVKNLTIEALKNLVTVYFINQEGLFKKLYKYEENAIPEGKQWQKIRSYLKHDGARTMPEWKFMQLIDDKVTTIEEFLSTYSLGKDGITACRPVRYGINFLTLKHSKTVEFRCFRGSIKKNELLDCFEFVHDFVLAGINGKDDFYKIINKKNWQFPPMRFDEGQAVGWVETKHNLELTKNKNRVYWDIK